MSKTALKLAEYSQRILDEWKAKDKDLSEIIADKAREQNLNKNEIDRLIEASNTGAMLYLYKAKGDKTVEFEIATREGVNRKLNRDALPETLNYYDRPETNYNKVEEKKYVEKKAESRELTQNIYISSLSVEGLEKRANSAIEKLGRLIEEIQVKIEDANHRIPNILCKVASALRRGDLDFDEFENICLHKYGELAEPVIITLAKFSYGNRERLIEKKATYLDDDLADKVGEVLIDLNIIKEAKVELPELYQELDKMKEVYNEWGKKFHGKS